MSEEDKYRLRIFQMHLRRLSKFTRPLYGKSGYTVKYAPDGITRLKTKNLATELRMAAIIGEIRTFMLNDDPGNFNSVANITSRYYQNSPDKVKKIRAWKKQWRELFSHHPGIVVQTNKSQILSTWGEVLDVLTYGKFVHNTKEKHETYSYTETEPMLIGHIGLTFSAIAVNIDKFLRTFDHHFVEPIMENLHD